MKKRLFIIIIVITVAAGVLVLYWYYKPRPSLANVSADFTISAKALYQAFQENEDNANQRFVGKVLLVTGIVETVELTDSTTNVLLAGDGMGGVSCQIRKMVDDQHSLTQGQEISIKGKCIGFLMDVNLVDAVIGDTKKLTK